jgi:hypothetical protein
VINKCVIVLEEHTARKSVKADCLAEGQWLWDEKAGDGTYGPLICRAALCGPFGGGGGGGGFDLQNVRNEAANKVVNHRTC